MIARWTAPSRLKDALIEEGVTIGEEKAKRICEKMGWSKKTSETKTTKVGK